MQAASPQVLVLADSEVPAGGDLLEWEDVHGQDVKDTAMVSCHILCLYVIVFFVASFASLE